jgi:hypothetical protein
MQSLQICAPPENLPAFPGGEYPSAAEGVIRYPFMQPRRTSLVIAVVLPLAAVLGALGYWLLATSRAMTRSPRYRRILKDGSFELRDYPQLALVNAPMGGAGMDGSFRRLFRYITGGNERAEKIAMTTPVLIGEAGGSRTMGFIMPEELAAQGVPKPLDQQISLGQIDPGRFAVLRFSGGRSGANEARAIESLTEQLAGRHIGAQGAPVIAYYDPPWTPVFLRRNEVMIPVKG